MMRRSALVFSLGLLAALSGCGAPDFSSGLRGGGLDSGLGGGYGTPGGLATGGPGRSGTGDTRGTYPRVDVSMELAGIDGNPFDYQQNDIKVHIQTPTGASVAIPAFYDGGQTWRVRYTPTQPGRFSIRSVTRNGKDLQPSNLEPRDFTVSGTPSSGFVRTDERRGRFVCDDGSLYYPVGMNAAWGEVASILGKLGGAGGNWARVWMCHWGGSNLDWVMNKKVNPGELDLEVARWWDRTIEAAEHAGVRIQVVLQHHGQYSTRVNPNWAENPWNKANGGFLSTPGEFFSDSRAIALTRAKYRYILARWGYSPSIMAWELFNEVEWTDAVANKHTDEVVAWHRGMAKFLRDQDPYRHLITTSSMLEPAELWADMDYIQPHAYPGDALAVTNAFDHAKRTKPVFYGEIGPGGLKDDGTFLHKALWSSVVSMTPGAAQYWSWDQVDQQGWYDRFRPVADFVSQSGAGTYTDLMPASVQVQTSVRGPLALRPGGGWASVKQTEYVVRPDGAVESVGGDRTSGTGAIPSYLQGQAHKDMFSRLTLRVDFPEAGSVGVSINQVARSGGRVTIHVDGARAAEKTYPSADKDRDVNDVVSAKVGAGAHTIQIENDGPDWVVMSAITLDPYAPALGVLGKVNNRYALLWVYNRLTSSTSGVLTLRGMKSGSYEAVWYDTTTGKVAHREPVSVKDKGNLTLKSPVVIRDTAVVVSSARPTTAPKDATSRRRPPSARQATDAAE